MKEINLIKGFALFFIVLFILGIIVSYTFNVDFIKKYIDKDGKVEKDAIFKIDIFQKQMFYLSLSFGFLGALMLIFSKKLRHILNKRKRLFHNILVLIVTLILFMIIGEIILRIFFSHQIYSEYGVGPGGLRFLKNIKYNSFGYRYVEHSIQKDNQTFRIIVIGDSCTFGYGIDNTNNTYPRILQRKLSQD